MRAIASVLVASAYFLTPASLLAQARTVFDGRPSVKVSEGGVERTPETLPLERSTNLHCVISQIDGKFYWASRGNVLLVPVESGAFTTYVAINGSGYVRVIKPADKAAASMMSGTEATFDYVEHLTLGLRSISYVKADASCPRIAEKGCPLLIGLDVRSVSSAPAPPLRASSGGRAARPSACL